jgi:hypothetical protein
MLSSVSINKCGCVLRICDRLLWRSYTHSGMFSVTLICVNKWTNCWVKGVSVLLTHWVTDAAHFSATKRLIVIGLFCRHVIPTWKVATTWRKRIGNTARYCCHLWHFLLTTCTLFCQRLSNVTILLTCPTNRNVRDGRIERLCDCSHLSQCIRQVRVVLRLVMSVTMKFSATSGVPRDFVRGGVQQIQLRTEDR